MRNNSKYISETVFNKDIISLRLSMPKLGVVWSHLFDSCLLVLAKNPTL